MRINIVKVDGRKYIKQTEKVKSKESNKTNDSEKYELFR